MGAWHKRRDPLPNPDLNREDLVHLSDGFLVFFNEDGTYVLWRRQQPPIPGVLLVDEVREPGPQYKAEWTIFTRKEDRDDSVA